MRARGSAGVASSGASAASAAFGGRRPESTPAAQQRLRHMFSAAATNWEKEVGKKVEVKGNWWVGGTAAERGKWHMVTVIEYTGHHEFEVKRKGQPTSQRIGKALKIRVDAVDDSSEDAWMDDNQYAKYKGRFEQKVKDGAIVENARTLLRGVLGTVADDDDGNGAGGDDGSSPDAPVRRLVIYEQCLRERPLEVQRQR